MVALLDNLFSRANLNDPNVPLTGQNLTASQTFGHLIGASASGETVNSTTMLRNSAVWAAYDIISTSVAKLPASVHRRLDPQGAEVDSMHKAHNVLHRRPNDYMTPFHLKQVLQGHAIQYGNGFGWIIRDGGAAPTEIIPLMPNDTWLDWVGDELWCNTSIRGVRKLIPYIDVLHIRGTTSNGLVGYMISAIGSDTIGLGMALKKFSNRFFKNGARPSVTLEHPGHLSDTAAIRLRKSFEEMYGGADNAGRAALLEEGMKANFLTMSPEDSQALDSMQWNVNDVARLFRCPPHKVGDLTHATFSNIAEANRDFLVDCLDPWLTVWEQESEAKLLTENEKRTDSHFVKFNTGKLLRMDVKTRYETYEIGIRSGILAPNEGRDLEDMNPYEGGDTFQQTLNNAPVGGGNEPNGQTTDNDDSSRSQASSPPESQPVEQPDSPALKDEGSRATGAAVDARRAVLVDAFTRMTKRLAVHANKAAKHPEQFCDWIDGGMSDHTRTLLDVLTPAAALIGRDPLSVANELRTRAVSQLSELVERTTYEALPTEVASITDTWQAFLPTDLTSYFLEQNDE